MATTTTPEVKTGLEHAADIEKKIEKMRELFADAPEVGKAALRNVLQRLKSDASMKPPPPVESAGRAGSRLGKVSS